MLKTAENKDRSRKAETKDQTITVGGATFAGPEALVEAARALVSRGAPYVGSEPAVLGAAWPHVQHRPVVDGLDVLLVEAASKFARTNPRAREPAAATPFDDKITAAERELEPAREAFDRAREARDVARDAYAAAVLRFEGASRAAMFGDARPPAAGPLDRAREALRVAERALVDADKGWLAISGRLVALELCRDRYRAERSTFVIGRDGTGVPLVDFEP